MALLIVMLVAFFKEHKKVPAACVFGNGKSQYNHLASSTSSSSSKIFGQLFNI